MLPFPPCLSHFLSLFLSPSPVHAIPTLGRAPFVHPSHPCFSQSVAHSLPSSMSKAASTPKAIMYVYRLFPQCVLDVFIVKIAAG